MPRPSSIDRLPVEIRVEIGRLREVGHTLDEILAHLADMRSHVAISRSALGRHVKGLDQITEKMKRSRTVAEALARELGTAPESKAARLNIELLHSAVMDLFLKTADADGTVEGVDGRGLAALSGNPEGMMMLAKALDHLGRASKSNVEFVVAAEKRAEEKARRAAAEAVDEVAKADGISAATVDAIKAKIFGVEA